jgi:hypothetical protein
LFLSDQSFKEFYHNVLISLSECKQVGKEVLFVIFLSEKQILKLKIPFYELNSLKQNSYDLIQDL